MKSTQPVAVHLPLSQEVAALAGWCALCADALQCNSAAVVLEYRCLLTGAFIASCLCIGLYSFEFIDALKEKKHKNLKRISNIKLSPQNTDRMQGHM